MIIYLPYAGFTRSAKILKLELLNQQQADVCRIFNVLHEVNEDRCDMGEDWLDDPAVKMWRDHAAYLATLGLVFCAETKARTALQSDWFEEITWHKYCATQGGGYDLKPPLWLGDERLHLSHRSELMRLDPDWYGMFFDVDTPNIPLLWPVGV